MQKLSNIAIKNFKSISDAKINDCRRVNIFIGYPNVGKSNILEAIGLLTFIRQNRPVGFGNLVRFEKFTQIFNFSNIQIPATIDFNDTYSLKIKYENEINVELRLINKANVNGIILPISLGKDSISSGTFNDIDNFSGRFVDLKDLQINPYKISEAKVFNQKTSALELNIPYGKNMFEVIINNPKLQSEFRELLIPYDLNLIIDASDSNIKISPQIKDGIIHSIPISLMADTLARLVFFKTAIISNKDSVLLFEEPEAHMFPPYISKFAGDMVYDENNNQFFITTHSPFVLNDLLENAESEDLAIYIVSYKKETGETIINRMSDLDKQEAYQFGYDFFMNINQFIPQETNG